MCNKPNCNHQLMPRGYNASTPHGILTPQQRIIATNAPQVGEVRKAVAIAPAGKAGVSTNATAFKSHITPTKAVAANAEQYTGLDLSWLRHAAEVYKISPDLKDYIFVTVPICPADLPNRNGIAFPLRELLRFRGPPVGRQTYKAWAGQPVHYEHDNEVDERAYGVIVDTMLRRDKFGIYHVYGLLAIDTTKYPDIVEQVRTGELNTYSMGALVDNFRCSICDEPLTSGYEQPELNGWGQCGHITHLDDVNWKVFSVNGKNLIAHLIGEGISPIETSIVGVPAWSTALTDIVV